MAKKKKILILGILLLAVLGTGIIAYTYSRYMSRATGTADLKVATWAVKVNNTDIVQSTNFVFDENNITWSQSDYIEEGYIAPSRTGTIRLRLDTTGSKVAVKYTINIDTSALNNYKQIRITKVNGQSLTDGTYTGIIALPYVNTPIEIPIEIAWINDEANNESDTMIGSTLTELTIPITVTAEQLVDETAVENNYCLRNGFNRLSDCMLVAENKSSAVDNAKSAITAKGTPDFSKISTTAEGLYSASDDDGTSYYYRGDVRNNYVSYAGYIWRIIRENGDGSVRMIYSGTKPSDTGAATSIGISSFNLIESDSKYIGYRYDENQTDSTIKAFIDNWYEKNILNKGDASNKLYSNYISDEIFCNDRSVISTSAIDIYYGAYDRLVNKKNPILKCSQSADKFSISAIKGNAGLKYSIGLITADEVSMAGGISSVNNTQFYLYTGQYYWTMSPSSFYSGAPASRVWHVSSVGELNPWRYVANGIGVRPVTNLSADVLISGGDGTAGNPYTVKLAE